MSVTGAPMPAGRRPVWVVIVLAAVVFSSLTPGEAKMSEKEFNTLRHRFKEHASHMDAEHYKLLFDRVNFMVWNSPESVGAPSTEFQNYTYNVVLYHVPPFVNIDDREASAGGDETSDPGNRNQTRTPENGGISGITIDFLGQLSDEMGVKFKYYYPCTTQGWTANATCDKQVAASSASALEMLSSVDDTYLVKGSDLCADANKCLSAGAHKISEKLLDKYFPTQPYMEKGFRLVVMSQEVEPIFMSWAGPFTYQLWVVVIAEIIAVGLAFIYVEGYGTNPQMPTGFGTRLFDAMYWSMTIVLGVADKQATTHAGRTLTMAQLFFTLLLIAVYTGNLNSVLQNVQLAFKVDDFSDFVDRDSKKFNADHKICYSTASTNAFLDLEAGINQGIVFNRVMGDSPMDCMLKVYKGEADATFYDEPVVKWRLGKKFDQNGMCGEAGGVCSSLAYTSKKSCEKNGFEYTEVAGTLSMTGELFSSFGYALVFPRSTNTDFMAFSQATQYLKERGSIDLLEDKFITDERVCASTAVDLPILGIVHIQGLLMIVSFIAGGGLAIGFLEHLVACIMPFCPCCKSHGDQELTINIEDENGEAVAEGDGAGDGASKLQEAGDDVLAPPPEIDEPEELTLGDAVLELQTRLDRIEDLLQAATENTAATLEASASKTGGDAHPIAWLTQISTGSFKPQ